MSSIIVVMPTIEEARKIGGLLNRHGYRPDLVCSLAADALNESCRLDNGVIICGSRLNDMSFIELNDCIPRYFRLIILSRNIMNVEYPETAVRLQLPLKMSELIRAIDNEASEYFRHPSDGHVMKHSRDREDRKYIDKAKEILIKTKGMTEPEAHRYLQKTAMDNSTSLVETARMVILLN